MSYEADGATSAARLRDRPWGRGEPLWIVEERRRAEALASLTPFRPKAPDLERMTAIVRRAQRPFRDIAVARGWAGETAIARAEAKIDGRRFVDLDRDPPDASLLADDRLDACLQLRAIPWRRFGGAVAIAAADPNAAPDNAAAALGLRARQTIVVQATRGAIDRAIHARFEETISRRAATTAPRSTSARAGSAAWQRLAIAFGLLAFVAGVVAAPDATWTAAIAGLTLLIASTSALRVAVLLVALRRRSQGRHMAPALAEADLPTITILAPLARESAALPALIDALTALDYPRERLDVMLVIEADDVETWEALRSVARPPWVRAFEAPPGGPRTKPRALNAAMLFARGEIVGIYDAEDRPERDQLRRVAATFAAAEPETACVQARLAYYNASQNWLSRCFAIEYAVWFDLLLSGLKAMRLPIPLGGTSVFLRADVLREIGGWDAHNVTEDADLGLRLARAGWRCALVDSTTYEEAACRPGPWIRQRSRWVKGYLQTWIAHMRRPREALQGFGLRGFLALQVMLLGAAASYLAQPLFWGAAIYRLNTGAPLWTDAFVPALAVAFAVALAVGQIAMLATALIAVRRRRMGWLTPWCLTLPLYWPLGACAALKAVWELFTAPTFWDKTEHGASPPAQQARAAALRRLGRDT